jgi:tRNA(fMet)-specific endonuclease VapC
MSLYILDTDVLSLFQRGHPVVNKRLANHAISELAITVLSVEEQLSGWYTQLRRAKNPSKLAAVYQRLANTVSSLSRLTIISFSEPAILRYEELRRAKLAVKKMDLRIAAVALEHRAIVVTRNLRDFQQVPGLTVQDWTV